MTPAVLAGPLVDPLTAERVLPMEPFVAAAAAVDVAEIAAEVVAALELAEVRVVGSAVVAAVAVPAADEGCCCSSWIARHCWLAADRLIELGNH